MGPVAYAQTADLKHPDWHPESDLLISEGSCNGNVGLYLVDLAIGSVRLLFSSEYTDGYPRWFSDGQRIAFHQINARRESKIQIATVSDTGELSDIQPVTEGPFDVEPAPSPDGTQIAYSALGKRGQDIALARLAGGRPKVWETEFAESFPSWHPDGGSIIFHATEDERTQIYQRLLLTYQLSEVTSSSGPNLVGHFSADGKRMVFTSERNGDREIYLKELESGTETRLTNREGRDEYPKFSPDGSRIAYHSDTEDGPTIIRVLNLDSGETADFSCSAL